MFLHSGASLHGHEYSDRPSPAGQHAYKRSPLLRSAFATPKSRPVSLDGARPTIAAEPRRQFSDVVPRLPEPVVRFLEPSHREIPGTPMTEDAVSVMSASELSDASQPSGAATVAPSETSKRRRSRASSRGSRKTTTLALAYPAPRFAGKKRVVQKVAPKLFLQLQEVSLNKRPKPVIDVFPSSRIAGPVIAPRLAKRFPGLFGPKGELGSADVVLMRSEDYDTVSEDVDSEDEEGRMEQRQPVAVLSPVKKSDHTEIVLNDGSVWVAQPLPTGSFDFVTTDEHGNKTTARWARRPVSKPHPTPTAQDAAAKAGRTASPESAGVKYTFSIIDPESRRHPVMATLTPQFLGIQDTYTSLSTSSGRYPPCRPLGRSATMTLAQQLPPDSTQSKPALVRSASAAVAEPDSDARRLRTPEPETERIAHPVDEATKLLISVTAVFLALESGWSPYFRPHAHHTAEHHPVADSSTTSPTVTETPFRCRPQRDRRNSSDDYHHHRPEALRKGSSTFSSGTTTARPHSSRDQSPDRSSGLAPGAALPPPWWETAQSQVQVQPQSPTSTTTTPTRPPPRRATSTGAAFMQRSRIASAAQHVVESSDSEHQPTTTNRQHRRQRILSGGGGGMGSHADKDKDGSVVVTHSTPVASSPAPAAEALWPRSMDEVVVAGGQDDVPDTATPARTQSRRARETERDRKAQSAYYPASPPMVAIRSDESGVAMVAVPAPPAEVALLPGPVPGLQYPTATAVVDGRKGPDRGFGGRMKSLGHWFRRLGGHDRHHQR